MKKRYVMLLLILVCTVLGGCCLRHEWKDATCEDPMTCVKCEKTEGESLGHDWDAATCETPKTCSVCDKTEGEPLGHTWADATCAEPKTCTVCKKTEGETLEHNWEMIICETPYTCSLCGATQGDIVHEHLNDWQGVENADGTVTISGECAHCEKNGSRVYSDWEEFKCDHLVGTWEAFATERDGVLETIEGTGGLTVRRDGTFHYTISVHNAEFDGTWEYDDEVGDCVFRTSSGYVFFFLSSSEWPSYSILNDAKQLVLFQYVPNAELGEQ